MKQLVSLVIICAALSMITVGSALAEETEESKFEFGLSTDFFGKYVWRGQNLVDDPVFQPSASVTYEGLTAAVWGNLDLTSVNDSAGDFTEYDYSLDYSGQIPGLETVGYSVGLIYYQFPGIPDTTEVYLGFGFDVPLSPTATVYYDIDEVDGLYAALSVGHSFEDVVAFECGTSIGIELGASIGYGDSDYNAAYWGVGSDKFNDLTTSISFPTEIAGISVTPSLNYVTLLSSDLKATDAYNTSSDYFFAGISLSKSF